MLSYEIFYAEMESRLRELLPKEILARKPEFRVRSNRMQIFMKGITGSHYEICLRRDYHEIALHFESTAERSLARRQAFDPLLKNISDSVGVLVRAGPHENQGWMRVWLERPLRPLTDALLAEYTEIFAKFITVTYPVLENLCQNSPN